jgi:hypothetical protein
VGDDLAGEILVGEVDAGVDDADPDPGTGGGCPGRGGADLLQGPLLPEAGVVRRVGGE